MIASETFKVDRAEPPFSWMRSRTDGHLDRLLFALMDLFGRNVDLVEAGAISNVLKSHQRPRPFEPSIRGLLGPAGNRAVLGTSLRLAR